MHEPELQPITDGAASGALVPRGVGATSLAARRSAFDHRDGVARDLAALDAIRLECRALVARSAGISGIAAVVPIPAADIGVDVALFLKLLPEINRRFGLSPEQIARLDTRTRELVLVGVTSIGSQVIGRVVSAELVVGLLRRIGVRVTLKSAARWVPFIGQAAAATISFGTMRLVGNRHVEECYTVARAVLEARRPTIDVRVVA